MQDEVNAVKDVPSGRAISIRQPYIEEILRGLKKFEYRSRPTKIRGRVFLYASMSPGDMKRFAILKKAPGDLPTGLIVGSVEIVDCKHDKKRDCFAYKLKSPKRYKKHLKPKMQAQPCWFFPFGKKA
jgi:hypothetical protein